MQIQNASHSFPRVSGNGPQVATETVTFPAPVSQASAILTGFIAEFSPRDDHHLGQLDVQVVVPTGGVNGTVVTINVTYGLRDWSGNWDDFYDGQIFFSVIAE
jgi:hypothetical protein